MLNVKVIQCFSKYEVSIFKVNVYQFGSPGIFIGGSGFRCCQHSTVQPTHINPEYIYIYIKK